MENKVETILVIEDDIGLQILISDKLESLEFTVVTASSGKEAKAWLATNRPLMMLLDYNLPDMKGKEFIESVIASEISLPPFVVATGQGDERIAVDMMKLGAKDYVIKDTNFLEMIPLVVFRINNELKNENKLVAVQQELYESNLYKKQIIDSANEGIVVFDVDKRFKVFNPYMERITGLSANDVLGKTLNEVFPEEADTSFLPNVDKALQGLACDDFEIECNLPINGGKGWVYDKTATLYDGSGVIIGAISTLHDITARKKAEKSILESEELYRTLVLKIPDGVYKSSPAGKFIEVNPAMVSMLGYDSKEELMNIDIKSQLYFELSDRDSLVLNDLDEEMGIFQLKKKDGTGIWTEDHGWYNKDAEGNVVTHEGVLRDISERVKIEKELKRSQAEFKELFDNAPVGYHELNSKGEIILVNQTELKILDCTAEEILGKYIWDVWTDHAESMKTTKEKLKGNANVVLNYERLYEKKNKEKVHLLIQDILLYGACGNVTGIRSSVQDFTERKIAEKMLVESQERYSLAIQATKDGIWERNLATGEAVYSPRWCEIIGYDFEDPELEHTYDSWAKRIHPDDRERVISALDYFVKNNGQYDVEYRHLHKSGEYKWQKSTATIVLDENGLPNKIVGCMSDISERKEAEEALKASEDKYRTMIENSNDLIWIINSKGEFTFANDVGVKATGLELVDWIGKSFVPLVLPEELELLKDIVQRTFQGESCSYEMRYKKSDNTFLTLSVNSSPIYSHGKIENIVSFARDITEAKMAEKAKNDYMEELLRFQNLTVGRELTMINLKKEVNELLVQSGNESKYRIVE